MLTSMTLWVKGATAVVLLCGAVATAQATPYLPAGDAQVLERLPRKSDPAQRELQRLRMALSATPDDLALATDLARRYIDTARGEADPRYLGYAQAALAPWWQLPHPPLAVLLLRATLAQSAHRFPQALADLDTVLQADRDNPQAWLTRATVLTVQGEYEAAQKSCARLYRLAAELITQTCLLNVANLHGDAARSYALLNRALQRNADAEPALKVWVETLLAEMAQRLDDHAAAHRHFRLALAASAGAPNDSYLLGAYADFLLQQGRNEEVLRLLRDKTRVDSLLLRYALALQAEHSPLATAQIDALRARFEAATLRGDTLHQREQARFELHLMRRPAAALQAAQANWLVQKEPADARALLEAALAARDRAAAHTILAWIRRSGLEDGTLQTLLKRAKDA